MEFTAAQDGLRVDVFLAGCLPELTRSAVQRLLAEGSVTCGGAPVRKKRAHGGRGRLRRHSAGGAARGDRCTGYPARHCL